MPDRLYGRDIVNPKLSDRFFAHSILTVMTAGWLLIGITSILEACTAAKITSSTIAIFPAWSLYTLGSAFFVGGAINLWTIFGAGKRMEMVWAWRKFACTLIIIAAGIYTYYVFKKVPLETLAIIFGASNLFTGLAELITTIKIETSVRKTMREQGYEA